MEKLILQTGSETGKSGKMLRHYLISIF